MFKNAHTRSKTLFFATLFCGIFCTAADNRVPNNAALLYPFNDVDKALFYNHAAQKIESPYSTASVSLFPETEQVTIEKSAYDQLYNHALARNDSVGANIPSTCIKGVQEIYNGLFFVRAVDDQRDKKLVQLSERDLMRLLQWSRGIETVWLGAQGSESDFIIDIKLNSDTILTASKYLKAFIIRVHTHEQEKKQRWFGH